jgi:hypothetical protein
MPKINLIIQPNAIYSLILCFGLTIEDAYTNNDEIKIYYRGTLEAGTYLYVDDILFKEATAGFYYDNISKQVFHLDLSSNVGMITKITIKPSVGMITKITIKPRKLI